MQDTYGLTMNRDDIIRMYEKANGWNPEGFDNTVKELERFARLIAAAEREACAKFFEDNESEIFFGAQAASALRAKGQALGNIKKQTEKNGLTSLQRQLIDAEALASDPAGLKTMNKEAEKNGEKL